MSATTPPDDAVQHTVAVYLPGTNTRVLVTCLDGPPGDAIETARWHVGQFAYVAPAQWLAKVVETHEITSYPPNPIEAAQQP